jgi:MFS family permease
VSIGKPYWKAQSDYLLGTTSCDGQIRKYCVFGRFGLLACPAGKTASQDGPGRAFRDGAWVVGGGKRPSEAFCTLAPTYPLLVAARVLAGAFGGVTGALILAIIGDVIPEERRGAAMGLRAVRA